MPAGGGGGWRGVVRCEAMVDAVALVFLSARKNPFVFPLVL